MAKIQVTKRDGKKESLDLEKIHKVVFWATDGITGVSASELELKSQLQFFNGMRTTDIQETLIKSAADLITEDTPNYQYVAGRLVNYHLRKEVYGQYQPWHILDVVKKNTDLGYYDPELINWYTDSEWDKINSFIKHDRDMDLVYAAMEQLRGKYLVQNRVTKQIFETPQVCYILVAASLFHSYPKGTRLQWVKDYYDAVSKHDISLPTPVMAGVRTNQKQFSSCVLVETADSLDSINATTSAIVKYVSQKAGIGIGAGAIRAIDSPVRNGDTRHTGAIPFYKLFQSAVKSCSQGSIRNGSATLYYPIWTYEVENLLVLKNNKGIEENRVRHIDYGVQFNKLMYERLLTGGDITLFSPNAVPGMYDAFFNNQDKFRELYEAAEKNPVIRKKSIKASELFAMFMQERKDTGRVYLQNVDHCNTHGSFDENIWPIRMSNLCCEITLPTKPLNSIDDPDGVISLCTLSAINWGNVKQPSDFERMCTLAVRGLDALLSYQNYPILAAYKSTMNFRPLGVGIINFAYFLAKNDVKYDESAFALVDEYAEAWSYYLIKASADLAKEQGACLLSHETKYGKGILPIDTYKKEVDELHQFVPKMPWEELRQQLLEYGIRNATLMALMPSESSSIVANATNGIEPPRALISVKQSKDGVMPQVVPEFRRLRNKYDLLWDQKSPMGYLKITAILQRYIDQAISTNVSVDPSKYPDQKVPMSDLLGHLLMFYKYGGKLLYYHNTMDGAGEVDVDNLVTNHTESQVPPDDDASCESCVI